MGLSPFKRCSVYSNNAKIIAPNPNPLNFKILELHQMGNSVIAKIKYPDCTNFEGIKICVFENTTNEKIKNMIEIDPHFSQNNKSPIARFKPTDYGMKLAISLAYTLNRLNKSNKG